MLIPHSPQIVPVLMLTPPCLGGQGTSLLTMQAEEVVANMIGVRFQWHPGEEMVKHSPEGAHRQLRAGGSGSVPLPQAAAYKVAMRKAGSGTPGWSQAMKTLLAAHTSTWGPLSCNVPSHHPE